MTTASEVTTPAAKKPAKKATKGKPAAKKAGKPAAKAAAKPKEKVAKTPKAAKEPKVKKPSLLDSAAKVLAASSEPMNAGAMVDACAKKGLWESKAGKTPAATLSAASIREIAKKGKESRVKKVDRGVFAAN